VVKLLAIIFRNKTPIKKRIKKFRYSLQNRRGYCSLFL
jgi:hypothetical protein